MQFAAKDFVPRSAESYDYHCALLDGPLAREYSITYGINHFSPLNDIENFHVVNQLPQDVMHCLLEGVIPLELKLMLANFIEKEKFFNCDQLNGRIASFSYSTQESKDKPSPIRMKTLLSTGTISQSCKL